MLTNNAFKFWSAVTCHRFFVQSDLSLCLKNHLQRSEKSQYSKILLQSSYVRLALLIFCFSFSSLHAAPRRYPEDSTSIAIREMRDLIDDLRHEVSNHEQEIKTYQEKIHTLENIVESFSQESRTAIQLQKQYVKESTTNLELKINSIDTTAKNLIADIKQFKNHANDSSTSIGNYKAKLSEIEKVLEIQNQNIDSLQSALKSIAEALQVKTGLTSSSANTYKVVAGDSLEKIARKNQTTIQKIKELNNLSDHKIIVGQTLKMP